MWRQVTMVAKFLDLNNLSWQRRPSAFLNNGRKVWATVLFLSAIMHRKIIHVIFPSFFLPYLHDHGLLRSRNFATVATCRKDFSYWQLWWHMTVSYMDNTKSGGSFQLKYIMYKFMWRYDHRSGNCNLSNCKLTPKQFRDFNGIRTHGLCVRAAVL